MGIKPLPHFENLLHTFAMQYKIKVQGNIEIKNSNFSFMEGMEGLEKETLSETIRFRREDNSIWNTAEAGK